MTYLLTYPFGHLLFATPTPTPTSKKSLKLEGNKLEGPLIRQSDLQLIQELVSSPISENPFLGRTHAMVGELAELQRRLNATPDAGTQETACWLHYTASIQTGMDCAHQCANILRRTARVQLGVQLSQAICFLSTGYCTSANLCIHLAMSYAEAAGFDFSLKDNFDDPIVTEKAIEEIINRLIAASALIEVEQKVPTPVREATA